MMRSIEISPDVYSRLEKLVVGFDSPSNVIQRLLDYYETAERNKAPIKSARQFSNREIQQKISKVASRFDDSKLEKYCDKEFSKSELGISFPLFIRAPVDSQQSFKINAVKSSDGVARWTWKFEFHRNDYAYAICTQWYKHHDQIVAGWLEANG